MPFPSREIEAAYEDARFVFQGHFKDERLLYEAEKDLQPLYTAILKCVGEEKGRLEFLLEQIRELTEYERRHYFTEGWLSAAARG